MPRTTTKRVVMVSSMPTNDYINFLKDALGKDTEFVVYNPNEDLQEANFMLFTGGADVSPEYYGQSKGGQTHCNPRRDALEKEMHRRHNWLPKIGICRGSQFLTVMNGGRLIQHVNGHSGMHNIQTKFNMAEGHFKSYPMSSTHHQMMYPYNLEESRYELIAWSEYLNSDTYLNGRNVEMELPDDFLEPEIVFYPKGKALCIQGHPEYSQVPKETIEYVKELINKYLLNS